MERLSFEVGEVGEFTIETKNAGIGTLAIQVHSVKGAFKIAAEPVKDDDPHTLRACYDPKEAGDYIIAVRWSGTHVPGSPFNVNICKKPKPKKVKLSVTVKQVEGFDTIKESDEEEEDDKGDHLASRRRKKRKRRRKKIKTKKRRAASHRNKLTMAQLRWPWPVINSYSSCLLLVPTFP